MYCACRMRQLHLLACFSKLIHKSLARIDSACRQARGSTLFGVRHMLTCDGRAGKRAIPFIGRQPDTLEDWRGWRLVMHHVIFYSLQTNHCLTLLQTSTHSKRRPYCYSAYSNSSFKRIRRWGARRRPEPNNDRPRRPPPTRSRKRLWQLSPMLLTQPLLIMYRPSTRRTIRFAYSNI